MASQVRITIKVPRKQNVTIETLEHTFQLSNIGEIDDNRVKAWFCNLIVEDKITTQTLKLLTQIMELNYKNDLEVKIKDVLDFRMKPE